MIPFSFLSSLYDFLSPYRKILLIFTLAIVTACIVALKFVEIKEDITDMIPGKPLKVAHHFSLLQEAPFSKKVIINLEAESITATEVLLKTADRLSGKMAPPFFKDVMTGPSAPGMDTLFTSLLRALPGLATTRDLQKLEQRLNRETVRSFLEETYLNLISPGGWVMKETIKRDPLNFRTIVLSKLRHVSLVPEARLKNNHLVSPDGQSTLIIANTPVDITDSEGSRELLNHFQGLVKRFVPPSIKASLISGHRYTVANAKTIQRDLLVVLGCSSSAILVLFVCFLRSWSGIFVFLVPVSALFAAIVGVFLVYGYVSAMTIGFGSVLLGISVDFALHVYFALRQGMDRPGKIIDQVSRPVLFCGLTSIAAFATLLFSNLPGQRQLGLFSLIGIAVSLIISLITLPHLVRPAQKYPKIAVKTTGRPTLSGSGWIIVGWLMLLCLCFWQASHLGFNGDLRSLNYTPGELSRDEQRFKETWGNISGRVLIFAGGKDLESALKANEEVFSSLKGVIPLEKITSIAPLLPSKGTREENRRRWNTFWKDGRLEKLREILGSEAARLGFSLDAFTSFLDNLPSREESVDLKEWRKAGLGQIFDSMIIRGDDFVRVLTLVPDTPELSGIMEETKEELSNIEFVSRKNFGDMISKALRNDFSNFLLRASVAVIILLAIFFVSPGKILYTLIPVATGLIFMFGAMGFLDMPFNLFNIVATILVIGLAVDYGIFMVYKISESYDLATERAVLVSGLTTLAGFGALTLARHPALHSIGVTVLFGISAAVPSALFVLPALSRILPFKRGQDH